MYSGRPLAEPFYRPSAPSCAATTAGSTLSHPGTRAGGQRGEVPEEGLGLERTLGEGRVHRRPERAVTDASVGGHGERSGAEGEDGKNTTLRERIGSRKQRGGR